MPNRQLTGPDRLRKAASLMAIAVVLLPLSGCAHQQKPCISLDNTTTRELGTVGSIIVHHTKKEQIIDSFGEGEFIKYPEGVSSPYTLCYLSSDGVHALVLEFGASGGWDTVTGYHLGLASEIVTKRPNCKRTTETIPIENLQRKLLDSRICGPTSVECSADCSYEFRRHGKLLINGTVFDAVTTVQVVESDAGASEIQYFKTVTH